LGPRSREPGLNHFQKAKDADFFGGAGDRRGEVAGTGAGADAGQHRVELEGYGYRWFRIGGLDYILQRSK